VFIEGKKEDEEPGNPRRTENGKRGEVRKKERKTFVCIDEEVLRCKKKEPKRLLHQIEQNANSPVMYARGYRFPRTGERLNVFDLQKISRKKKKEKNSERRSPKVGRRIDHVMQKRQKE